MSDDVTDDVDLFDNEDSDETTDSETVTEDQSSESSDEQSDDVELKEPKKLTAEQQRNKQLEVWTQRVVDGEVALDDLPPNLKWLKKSIEKNLDAMTKQPEIADLVAKEVAKKDDERDFISLQKSLKNATLTKDQKKEVQSEFSELVTMGISRSKALAKAMKMAGVKEDKVDEVRKKNAALPKPGTFSDKVEDLPNITPEDKGWNDLTSDQRVTLLEKHRRQGMN